MIERLKGESQVVNLLMAFPASLGFCDLHPLAESLFGIIGQHNHNANRNGRDGLTKQMLANPQPSADWIVIEV
jgi:hypothetical protein